MLKTEKNNWCPALARVPRVNVAIASGKFSQQKVKLQKKFPVLTNADLHFEEGKRDEMFKNLQKKVGRIKRRTGKGAYFYLNAAFLRAPVYASIGAFLYTVLSKYSTNYHHGFTNA